MFGYVRPAAPELRLYEFSAYRAFYCGICKSLGAQCGPLCRFFLQYDFVLLGIVTDMVLENAAESAPGRCPVLPLRRRYMMRGEAVAYAADAHGLLLLGKSLDDGQDGGATRFLAGPLAAFMRGAAGRRPRLHRAVRELLERQGAAEREGAHRDAASEPFAEFCAAMFAPPEAPGRYQEALRWLGRNVGRWIYLADALEDYDRDAKRGSFNPLLGMARDEAVSALLPEMNLCAQEARGALDLLPRHRHAAIAENILAAGMPDVAEAVAERKLDKRRSIRETY